MMGTFYKILESQLAFLKLNPLIFKYTNDPI